MKTRVAHSHTPRHNRISNGGRLSGDKRLGVEEFARALSEQVVEHVARQSDFVAKHEMPLGTHHCRAIPTSGKRGEREHVVVVPRVSGNGSRAAAAKQRQKRALNRHCRARSGVIAGYADKGNGFFIVRTALDGDARLPDLWQRYVNGQPLSDNLGPVQSL